VWWAPGGLLGLLPLHAAGRHDLRHRGQTVIDRVVSSYTPTIRALHHARRQAAIAAATGPDRSLIVAMPTTPDLPASSLPFAAHEAALLADRLPAPVMLSEPVPGQAFDTVPTRDTVLKHLPDCTIAHFACHATHDPADPSRSRLLLHDHATAPLTVASLAPLRLQRAHLAYLSACSTAFHGTALLDESIHLASAFQLAGFPHVIATLWQIPDPIAPTVADAFYTRLRSGSDTTTLDPTRAAHALHDATRTLRAQRPDRPSLWAAYVHAGA
jgi:CHAT domain-containing protein